MVKPPVEISFEPARVFRRLHDDVLPNPIFVLPIDVLRTFIIVAPGLDFADWGLNSDWADTALAHNGLAWLRGLRRHRRALRRGLPRQSQNAQHPCRDRKQP